jgi:hypothetical protein
MEGNNYVASTGFEYFDLFRKPFSRNIAKLVKQNSLYISDITLLEVLGYHRLSKSDLGYFEDFISYCNQISISPGIIKKAISLRQSKAMSLGDSLIASSALAFKIPLVTLNIKDFKHISNLELIEPVGYKF